MVDTFLLAKSFVTLLVITDPLGTIPIFGSSPASVGLEVASIPVSPA
jgi:small neutral amino acid transporter SnatA (MarC family)